ncbi:unnamed protein product, partial [Ixodes pacificus]
MAYNAHCHKKKYQQFIYMKTRGDGGQDLIRQEALGLKSTILQGLINDSGRFQLTVYAENESAYQVNRSSTLPEHVGQRTVVEYTVNSHMSERQFNKYFGIRETPHT